MQKEAYDSPTVTLVVVTAIVAGWLFNIALPFGITVSHISTLIATGMLLCVVVVSPHRTISRNTLSHSVAVYSTLSLVGIWGLVATVESRGSVDISNILKGLSWPVMALAYVFGVKFANVLVSRNMSILVSWLGIAASISVAAISIKLDIPDSGALRYALNGYLPGGINGFMYGLLWVQVLGASLLTERRNAVTLQLLGFCSVLSPIMLNLFLGSRQYIVAACMLVVAIIWVSGRMRDRINILAVLVLLILIIVSALEWGTGVLTYVYQRASVSLNELQTMESHRIEIWSAAFRHIDSNILLGNGIGFARDVIGGAVDNFWIEFTLDYGIVGLSFLVAIICLELILVAQKIRRVKVARGNKSECLIWVGLMISVFWFAAFNEILREYAFWMFLGAAFGGIEKKKVVVAPRD